MKSFKNLVSSPPTLKGLVSAPTGTLANLAGKAGDAVNAITPASKPKAELQEKAGAARRYIKQTVNEKNLPVRLVLCFDGTGDTAEGSFSAVKGNKSGTKDSIYTIFDMTQSGAVTDPNGKEFYQYVQYFEGVATIDSEKGGLGVKITAAIDGATGRGYLDILREGYKVCCQQLQHNDGPKPRHELFIYGFSRGAFIARALASFLQHVGLMKEEHLDKDGSDVVFREKFRELLARYMKVTSRSFFGFGKAPQASTERPELLPFCIDCPRVRVLGAFDTVKTVIPLPMHNLYNERMINIDFQMDAPGLVDHFRHALALNEARPLFNPDLWKQPSPSSDNSYLEAWFFGYHHDIGGGGAVQGLALWPLQWVLQTSLDNGLVLDSKVYPYDILFGGGHQTVDTPHEIVLKMIDMVRHHNDRETRKVWGLKLNQPFSVMAPKPRAWFDMLTKPPYLSFTLPKVFVHPSAYLVFDISSSFRIQVHEWQHFRRFMSDRFETLSRTNPPWWEKQTIDTILKEATGVSQLNVLVIGRPKTGKEEMITKIFGKPEDPLDRGIFSPVKISGNDQVCIYFSNGFGPKGKDSKADVQSFLEQYCNKPDLSERLHAIWYFHDCAKDVQESEKELFQLDFGDVPVMVVLQNEDRLKSLLPVSFSGLSTAKEVVEDATETEAKTDAALSEELQKLSKQLPIRKNGQYVRTRTRVTPVTYTTAKAHKNLLVETARCYDYESVAITQIKAQRVKAKPKLALAIEEAVRAYTIWYIYKTTGEKHELGRNKNPTGMNLSYTLLEVVLNTFSMGFPDDAQILRKSLGGPWAALDGFKNGLCDENLSGGLILLCMVDAVLAMTCAVWNRTNATNWKGEALPLTRDDLERGCHWYISPPGVGRETPQQEIHRKILDLLGENSQPKDGCIANLQMQIIETVDYSAEKARKPKTIVGGVTEFAKDLAKGTVADAGARAAGIVTGHGSPGLGLGFFGGKK